MGWGWDSESQRDWIKHQQAIQQAEIDKAAEARNKDVVDSINLENFRVSHGCPRSTTANFCLILVGIVWLVHRYRLESNLTEPWWMTYALGTAASIAIANFTRVMLARQAWLEGDDQEPASIRNRKFATIAALIATQVLALAVSYDADGLGKKIGLVYLALFLVAVVIGVIILGVRKLDRSRAGIRPAPH